VFHLHNDLLPVWLLIPAAYLAYFRRKPCNTCAAATLTAKRNNS
jgi:hypothetical protein